MNTLLLLLVVRPQVEDSYLVRSFIEEQGFVVVKQWIEAPDRLRTSLFSCVAKSASEDKALRIGFSQTREEIRRGLRRGTSSAPILIEDKEESPSGLPLGRNRLFEKSSDPVGRPGGAGLRLEVRFESMVLHVSSHPPANPDETLAEPKVDQSHVAPFLEACARTVFSYGVGKRLRPSSPRQLNGSEVRAMACSFSGTLFYVLEDWAAARGWSHAQRGDGSVEGRWLVPARLDELAQ